MALYFSVQEQNELADNIWLNTTAGSDYIAQSVDEVRLVKKINQSHRNLWIKLISLATCCLLILLLILAVVLALK
jgi:t-SNARE complex subunit (syntaxin)